MGITVQYPFVMPYRAKMTSHVSKVTDHYTFEMRENPLSLFEKPKIHNDTNCVIISSQKPKHNLTKQNVSLDKNTKVSLKRWAALILFRRFRPMLSLPFILMLGLSYYDKS